MPDYLRSQTRHDGARRDGDVSRSRRHVERRRRQRGGAGAGDDRDAVVLPRPEGAAAARPVVHRRAGRARAGQSGRPHARLLAAACWRARRRDRAGRAAERRAVPRSSACCRRVSCSSIPRFSCSGRRRSRARGKVRRLAAQQQLAAVRPAARPAPRCEQAQSQLDAINAANFERFPQWREILEERPLQHRRGGLPGPI